jgi:hypothetical protein
MPAQLDELIKDADTLTKTKRAEGREHITGESGADIQRSGSTLLSQIFGVLN